MAHQGPAPVVSLNEEFSHCLARVCNDFRIDVVGYHLEDSECGALDLVGLQGWEGPEQFVGTAGDLSVILLERHGCYWDTVTYLGDSMMLVRIITSCATMHRILRCGP